MASKHRRGPWSQAEDTVLLQLVHSQGAHNWVRISQLIQSRSPKQCRERYHQNLKATLNLDPITPEEGVLIERMVAEMGKRWAEIARRLHGRSDNAVKNWWNGGMNRRKRLDNRRADSAARQPQPYLPSSEPQQQRQQRQQQQQHQQQQQQRMPAPHAQWHVEPRSHQFPQPINTCPITMAPSHRIIETPLPSPSAISCISRTDSTDGAPPSLVSDHGYYSAHSLSPTATPNGKDLPPISSFAAARALKEAVPHDEPSRHTYSIDSHVHHTHQYHHHHQQQQKQQPKQAQQHPVYHVQPQHEPQQAQWRAPAYPTQASSQGHLPLPSFKSLSVPQLPSHCGPPFPPRDSRMNLSSVIH